MNNQSSGRAVIELIDAAVAARRDPKAVALQRVNWLVQEGEYWVVGGLQGSGKSDLLCAAAALSKLQSGTYRLFGQEIVPTYDNEHLTERLRVALVFGEGGRLFNHLTVWENVALPVEYHRPARVADAAAHVDALLEATEIADWADITPSSLSLNWRQRVALARALALKPEVLLLDNPLSILDPWHTRWWMEFVSRLASGHPVMDGRPLTIVAATDDLRPWRRSNRKFALLQDTRLSVLEDTALIDLATSSMLRDLVSGEPELL